MKPKSAATTSVWMATANVPNFQQLTQDVTADVCVVGAGIAGLTTAYLLAKEGRKVIVLDDGPVAGGETQRTTAHLSNEIDDRYQNIIKLHGKEKARLAWDSQTKAIDMIEQIVREEKIECSFARVDGYLFVGQKQSRKELEKELQACREIGFESPELIEMAPLSGSSEPVATIRFPQQAQFHVLNYLNGVAKAIIRMGGSIYCQTHVTEVADGPMAEVSTADGAKVRASNVVVATNSPVTDWVKVHTKQAAYRTYVVAFKVPQGTIPQALFWDTEDPYHYVRTQPSDEPGMDYIIVGGEDHRTAEANDYDDRFQNLVDWALGLLPILSEPAMRWSGQVYEPVDGFPFIGKDPAHKGNVYIATGDSGMGMTNGTCAAMLLTDLIMGRENPWSDIYNPSRKPVKAAFEYIGENLNTAVQYMDYFKSDVKSAEEIEVGQGAIIDVNDEKVAAYRDMQGKLHQFSAACPHLKGIVQWNACESSWDCPAHGSRFTAEGKVIDGPANSDLSPCVRCEMNMEPLYREDQQPGEQPGA